MRFERDNRGGLVSKSPDGTNYYFYLFDGLGSVVAVTDPNGNVANSYAYDPYGNVVSSSTTVGNPFEYVSSWTSSVTTFTHFGARWDASDPNFTRWTQQDPIEGSLGNPTSQCRYAYAQDDPVNLVDPSGRQSPSGYLQQCLSQAWASFLAIGGGAAGLFSGLGTLLESGAVGFFTATGAYLSIIFGGIAVLYGLYQIQAACAPYAPFPPPGTLV